MKSKEKYPNSNVFSGIGTLPINGPIKGGFDGLPAALIALGCLVFALAFAAIIYLCIMKHK